MIILWILLCLMFLGIFISLIWRFVCLFRKEGSCRFTGCPFRRDYFSMSDLEFPKTGCTKCPLQEKEIEAYKAELDSLKKLLAERQNRMI